MLYNKKLSPSFWNFAYNDKRDGQKCHFTLKTYGGWKIIDFGDTKDIKMKMQGLICKY